MKYKNPPIGCYIEHANQNSDATAVRVIRLAEDFGFRLDVPSGDAVIEVEDTDYCTDPDVLADIERDAIDYLNEQETRSRLYWGHDGDAGAFGLWPDVEIWSVV